MAHPAGRNSLLALLSAALLLSATAAAPPSRDEAAIREARAVADRRDWKLAEKTVDEALLHCHSSDTDSYWALRVLRAEILNGQGQSARALQSLRPALPARLRTSRTAVHWLVQYATATDDAGRRDVSVRLFAQAHQLAATHYPALLPEVLNFIVGTIEWSHAEKAETTAREALRLAEHHKDSFAELDAMMSIAVLCIRQDRYLEGVHWLDEVLLRARALRVNALVQKAQGNLGFAYLSLGDSERAAQYFTDAIALASRIGALTDQIRWQNHVANVRFDREDYEGARKDYLAAYELAQDAENRGVILANLSNTSLRLGRLDDASRYNAEAQVIKKQQNDPEAILNSRILDARIATLRGDFKTAEELFRDVAVRSTVASTRWEAQGWQADVFAQTNRDDLADERFCTALASANATRASIGDDELKLPFLRKFDDIVDRYVSFLIDRGRTERALEVVEAVRGLSLEEGLSGAAARAKTSPRSIAARLGATLLCYRLGPARSYLWIVTPKGVTSAILPARRTIETAVDAYQREVVGPRGPLERSGASGSDLYRMLIPQAGNIPRDSLVIVVPDGRLGFMNFETLIVPTPPAHYWIEDVIVANAVSLQLLGRSKRKVPESPSLLLIGNPPTVDPAFPALTRAGDEIVYVAKRFEPHRSVVLEREKATPDAYESVAPDSFDYIHFVAHGESTRARPFDSAVILARGTSGYKLSAHAIVRRTLHARLVTISSCHGAGIKAYVGEGLIGLAWAFLRAGADNVVASLWDVSDEATPELMDRMYEGIRQGHRPASALRDAKRASKGRYSNPRYWAPFIFYIGS
jgi:CHAT domain-containing protein/tetratricopeptide (TPR) repeat protein